MIGQLRHRLTIETPVPTPDDGGGASLTWQTHATVWARVAAQGGPEIVRASELVPRATYRVTIRHRGDITTAMRVSFGGRVLEIDAAYDPDGGKRVLFIDCHDGGAL